LSCEIITPILKVGQEVFVGTKTLLALEKTASVFSSRLTPGQLKKKQWTDGVELSEKRTGYSFFHKINR